MEFQKLISTLHGFWGSRGCAIIQPWDIEKGAGTFNYATYLRALGPEPWSVAYVEPSRRPTDGRYGDNPNRLERHHQFQVLLKPSPKNVQELYLDSLKAIGIDPLEHDIRFVEDNWESPTLGAWGLGWEVWCDGMEITQFTYFQQCGGHNLNPISVELTYGLERIAMYLQNKENVFDLEWGGGLKYGDLRHAEEYQWSKHNFEAADVELYLRWFKENMQESARLCKEGLVLPAYDYCLRCSHIFNILDARGAISVTERQAYILRVRETSKMCADAFLADREAKNFPLTKIAAAEDKAAPSAKRTIPEFSEERGSFLLELGCEELPARLAPTAAKNLAKLVQDMLEGWGLKPEGAHCEWTPRRMAIAWDSINLRQPERVEEIKGPPVRIACVNGDAASGQYTDVGAAFQKKLLPGESVTVLETPKGPCIGIKRVIPSRSTAELLAESLPGIIAKLHWPKPMRWGKEPTPFGRPIHWIVCCLNGETVPFEFAGVQSDNKTRGHRFHFPESFAVKNWQELEDGLFQRKVVLAEQKRKELIQDAVHKLADGVNGKPVEDPALLDEVANIVEWPQPVLGSFSAELLELPRQAIVTPMRVHQRYFPVEEKSGSGKLLPHFITIAGIEPKNNDVVAAGNAKVLKARLDDARFFYERDLKTPLADLLPSLNTRIWLAKLGSVGDKVQRIRHLVKAMGGDQDADRAAELCKCDLATNMVGEFPELQGEMGRVYANKQGEKPAVAEALYESYLPRFAGDILPQTLPGTLVALADRFDSIVGCFGIGLKPTGNQDPYALRRQCIGILQIMTQTSFPIVQDIEQWVRKAVEGYGSAISADCVSDIMDFFADRMRFMYANLLPPDVVGAVVAAGASHPKTVYAKIHAVAKLLESGQLEPVLTTFKRVAKITGEHKGGEGIQSDKLTEDAEKNLFLAYEKCAQSSRKDLDEGNFDKVIANMGELRPLVDKFFDDILVMHDDPAIRAARLGLLCGIRDMFSEVADFLKIQDRKNAK